MSTYQEVIQNSVSKNFDKRWMIRLPSVIVVIVLCFPTLDVEMPLHVIARWTSLLCPVSLVICILWSLLADFDKATFTHCRVPQLLPSISSVIGGDPPQRFLWTFSVAITTGPRLVFCKLQYLHLCEKYSSYKRFIRWNFNLNVAETLGGLTLSLVTSSDLFLLHAAAFLMFILTSLISMTMVVYYIGDAADRETKKKLVIISWLSLFLAFYFYYRHEKYCEPYIYTCFALCEYLAVGCNLAWHSLTISQFSGLVWS